MILSKDLIGRQLSEKAVPFNMFCVVSIVVMLVHVFASVYGVNKDYTTALIFTVGILLMLTGMYLFRYISVFLAILLTIIVFNAQIFWVTFNLGRAAGAMLYYFPFSVGFLYLFLYNSKLARTVLLAGVPVLFFAFGLLYTKYKSDYFFLPDPSLEKIYLINLVLSIASTIIILASLYRHILSVHRNVLNDQEKAHRELLRDIDIQREKEEYSLLLSLRDDISQTLVTSRLYLQMMPQQDELVLKADSRVKTALNGLNDISLELSPSMLIDMGFRDGLSTYAEILTEKHGIPITIELAFGSADLPDIDRLSLYRILHQCINILSADSSTGFLRVKLNCGKKINIRFDHGSPIHDYASRFRNSRNRDLSKRLDYYSAEFNEAKGRVEMVLDMEGEG